MQTVLERAYFKPFFQLLIPFIQSCFALVFKIHNGTYKHINKNSFSIFFNYISSYDFCNLYSKNFIKELYYLILKSNFWTYSCHRHSENCVAYHNMIYLGNSYLNFDFIIALNLSVNWYCFALFFLNCINVLECPFGKYGLRCAYNCSMTCIEQYNCEGMTGKCVGGCQPGWEGVQCDRGKVIVVMNYCQTKLKSISLLRVWKNKY